MSELSLIAYVHMSKRVTILMLRICYNYIILVSIYLKLACYNVIVHKTLAIIS